MFETDNLEPIMDLLALADFNLVAKHGGFRRAAEASGRPKATLSRRVAELENNLQVRLFDRGSRMLKLTEEGMALYQRTSPLLTDLDEALLATSSGTAVPKGRLRISAPLLFCQMAMGKLAADFCAQYPEVQLEVSSDDTITDMVDEGFDLVIRVNPADNENLYGRIILRDRLVVVAGAGMTKPAEGEAVNAILRGSTEPPEAWRINDNGVVQQVSIKPHLRLSSMMMIRDAACSGAGAAVLPLSLVNRDIQSGALTYWGDLESQEINLWALYPSRRLLNARVSAFLEHLKNAFPSASPEELAAYMDG